MSNDISHEMLPVVINGKLFVGYQKLSDGRYCYTDDNYDQFVSKVAPVTVTGSVVDTDVKIGNSYCYYFKLSNNKYLYTNSYSDSDSPSGEFVVVSSIVAEQ